MHHTGLLGITGDADQPDRIEFTDARGSPIPACCSPAPPGEAPVCDRPGARRLNPGLPERE